MNSQSLCNICARDDKKTEGGWWSIQLQTEALAGSLLVTWHAGLEQRQEERDHWDILQLLGIKSALSNTPGRKKGDWRLHFLSRGGLILACLRLWNGKRADIMAAELEL